MFGSGFGFVLQQPSLSGAGGGGGGGSTYFADRFELVQTAVFVAGGLVLNLPNTPFDPDNLILFYNGVKVRPGAGGFSLSGNNITIDFGDDPTTYDTGNVVFEAYYLFT